MGIEELKKSAEEPEARPSPSTEAYDLNQIDIQEIKKSGATKDPTKLVAPAKAAPKAKVEEPVKSRP